MNINIKTEFNNQYLGIGKQRFKALFSMGNSCSIFRKNENKPFPFYECVSFIEHNCVMPEDVLTDIIYEMRSGSSLPLIYGDFLCIRINGACLTYMFCGFNNSNSFAAVDFPLLDAEKEYIIKQIHKKNMVLDILLGKALSIKDLVPSEQFFCIQKETYMQKSSKILSEYNIYKYHKNCIECINPNGNAFFDLNNILFYFYNVIKSDSSCILLYERKELEMIKDHYDLYMRVAYGA